MTTPTFLRLSAELRNIIYAYTFASDYAVEFDKVDIQHPLTRTCRQIRQESLAMYYTSTRFNAHLRDGPITPLTNWLKVIGREACLLVSEIRIWDMHDNLFTMLSPEAGQRYLEHVEDGMIRSISATCCGPEDNALPHLQRIELWRTIQELGLGLRQFTEQYPGLAFVLGTSWYEVIDLKSTLQLNNVE